MMNLKSSFILITFILGLIVAASPSTITLAQSTKKTEFYCGRDRDENGIYYPATMLITGKKPQTIVIWKQRIANISIEDYCDKISKRFEMARKNKQFDLLISGSDKSNGLGIICAIKYSEKKCNLTNMLFTVNSKMEAQEIVKKLYASMRQNGKPIPQVSSSKSIDIHELIDSIDR